MADMEVFKLYTELVRSVAECCGIQFQGLGCAARHLFRKKRINQRMKRKLLYVEAAFHVTRHLTSVSSRSLLLEFRECIGKLEDVSEDGKVDGVIGEFTNPETGEPLANSVVVRDPQNENEMEQEMHTMKEHEIKTETEHEKNAEKGSGGSYSVEEKELCLLFDRAFADVEAALADLEADNTRELCELKALTARAALSDQNLHAQQQQIDGLPDLPEFMNTKKAIQHRLDAQHEESILCAGILSCARSKLADSLRRQQHLRACLVALRARDGVCLHELVGSGGDCSSSEVVECSSVVKKAFDRVRKTATRHSVLKLRPGFGSGPRRTAKQKKR